MKSTIIAGDTLDFTTTVADYPPGDGYTLTYKLVPRSSGSVITFSASASGDDYRVQVGPSTTATWAAGDYTWAAYAIKSGARYTVDQGLLTVKPDPATASTLDGRSHARKVLDAVEAVLENRATLDQQEFQIGGRMLKRMPVSDLMKLRSRYASEVEREDANAKLAAGLGVARRIQVRC